MSDHGTESLRNLGINRFPVVVLYLKLAGLPNVAVVMAASLQSGFFFEIYNFQSDIYPWVLFKKPINSRQRILQFQLKHYTESVTQVLYIVDDDVVVRWRDHC